MATIANNISQNINNVELILYQSLNDITKLKRPQLKNKVFQKRNNVGMMLDQNLNNITMSCSQS